MTVTNSNSSKSIFGFLTELSASKVKEAGNLGRAKWELKADLLYHSRAYGLVIVPTGFITDFASVPRLPLAYWLTGDTAHASAAVHDYLVRVNYIQGEISWKDAAKVFSEAMKDEGVPAWRRVLMTLAVKLKGENTRNNSTDTE